MRRTVAAAFLPPPFFSLASRILSGERMLDFLCPMPKHGTYFGTIPKLWYLTKYDFELAIAGGRADDLEILNRRRYAQPHLHSGQRQFNSFRQSAGQFRFDGRLNRERQIVVLARIAAAVRPSAGRLVSATKLRSLGLIDIGC